MLTQTPPFEAVAAPHFSETEQADVLLSVAVAIM